MLFLATERVKPLDAISLFAGGAAIGYAASGKWAIVVIDITVTLVVLLANYIVKRKMRSYQ